MIVETNRFSLSPIVGGEGKGEGVSTMLAPPPHPSPLPRFAGAREMEF